MAQTCGFHDVPFFGDLYVGRLAGKENVDFGLGELASDATWMAGAVAANLEHSHAMEKFNSEMGGMNGMVGIDTEKGPARTEDDGTKGYSWEQSDEDIDVEVSLPPGLTKKHLTIKILPRLVSVTWPDVGVAKAGEVALKLFDAVRPDESTWTMDGQKVVLSMEKSEEGQWPMLILEEEGDGGLSL